MLAPSDVHAVPVTAWPSVQLHVLATQALPIKRKPALQDLQTLAPLNVHAAPVAAWPFLQAQALAEQALPIR